MSEFEINHTAVATIMIVMVFIASIISAGLAFGNSAKFQSDDMDTTEQRAALHALEKCLSNGGEYISADFLDSVSGLTVQEICGISISRTISAKVYSTDYEYVWTSEGFTEPLTEDQSHEKPVALDKGGNVFVGRLMLRVGT